MAKENSKKKITVIKSLWVILSIPFILIFIIIGELLIIGLAENSNKIIAPYGSNGSLEWFLCTTFCSLLLIRIIYHWVKKEAQPDPWDGIISESEISTTHIICQYCLSIEKVNDYYCSNCRRNIGNYNNVMPFLWIGFMGEFLLDGVQNKRKKTIFDKVMFCLLALSQYSILAPWYLYRVFSKPNDSRNK